MLVFRPEDTVGNYKGYYVMLYSNNPIEDYAKFWVVCAEFREKIKELCKEK